MESIDRKSEFILMRIETSDIIFKQNQANYFSTFAIISFQMILCIISIIVSFLFNDITTSIEGFKLSSCLTIFIAWINICLCILVVIINNRRNKSWKKAKESYNKLYDIMEPAFEKDYTIEDQTKLIETLVKYKHERRNKQCQKNTKIQKEKTLK